MATDFVVYINTSFEQYIQWLSPTGEVLSLAGWSAQLDARAGVGQPLILRLSTLDGTIQHVGDDLRLFLTPTQTLDLPEGAYHYDLLITKDDQRPILLKGALAVRPTITEVV